MTTITVPIIFINHPRLSRLQLLSMESGSDQLNDPSSLVLLPCAHTPCPVHYAYFQTRSMMFGMLLLLE